LSGAEVIGRWRKFPTGELRNFYFSKTLIWAFSLFRLSTCIL